MKIDLFVLFSISRQTHSFQLLTRLGHGWLQHPPDPWYGVQSFRFFQAQLNSAHKRIIKKYVMKNHGERRQICVFPLLLASPSSHTKLSTNKTQRSALQPNFFSEQEKEHPLLVRTGMKQPSPSEIFTFLWAVWGYCFLAAETEISVEQAAQGGCGVSFSGDIEDPPGQGPLQPAVGDPALAGGLD